MLEDCLNSNLSENSYAFCKGRGISDAVNCAVSFIDKECEYILNIDLENYFDSINHDILLRKLNDIIDEPHLLKLIESFFKCSIKRDNTIYTKHKGLVQGSPLSPILSNFFLCQADRFLEDKNIKFIRFADDIKILGKDYECCLNYKNVFVDFLEKENICGNQQKLKFTNYSIVQES